MECYYLVNVREYQDGISVVVYKQPLLDDMKIPDFFYAYDIDLDPGNTQLVFCHLRGFVSEDEALAYAMSFEDVKKKLFFFADFKRAFVDVAVDD